MLNQITYFSVIFMLHSSYYIGNKIERLDQKASVIKLPKMFRRNIRSFGCRQYMHANEFRTFNRYIGAFLLDGILPER